MGTQKTDTVSVITHKVSSLAEHANTLAIENTEDMKEAVAVLSEMNKISDRITEEKEKVTAPLNQALKAERSRWKPIETVYETAISALRSKMSAYQTAETKRQREEEDRIAARVGDGRGHLKVETAVAKIEALEKPEDRIETQEGMVKFRTKKTFRITDEKLIPDEYYVIDPVKVFAALEDGKIVPGAVIEEIQVPINYR